MIAPLLSRCTLACYFTRSPKNSVTAVHAKTVPVPSFAHCLFIASKAKTSRYPVDLMDSTSDLHTKHPIQRSVSTPLVLYALCKKKPACCGEKWLLFPIQNKK